MKGKGLPKCETQTEVSTRTIFYQAPLLLGIASKFKVVLIVFLS